MFFNKRPGHKKRACHAYANRFSLIAAGYDAAIVITQNHYRVLCQVRLKYPFAGAVKRIAVNNGVHGYSLIRLTIAMV